MFSKIISFALTGVLIGYANAQTFAGEGTFYHPGLGSCGQVNSDTELVAALNAPQYDISNPCGRRIRVNHEGKSVDVTIVDRCAGCVSGAVDLSPTAFSTISDLSAGRIPISWQFI